MIGLPKIQVYALGGTIAMTPTASGMVPSLGAAELVAAVPGLGELADISAETFATIASANLSFLQIKALCEKASLAQCDGIVVTQGTDTLEETSFLASLIYTGDAPLIFTGAMRTPEQLGADGPSNIYNAVLAACDAEGGVYVVMNGEVHDPWQVAKSHTSSLASFRSEDRGPVGHISEGALYLEVHEQQIPIGIGAAVTELPPVALLPAGAEFDIRILEQVVGLGYKGLVIEALGAGHLSEAWADAAETIAKTIPVIFTSRCASGPVFENTYGYKGAEIDLIERGLMPGGNIKSRKARLLLSVLLTDNALDWESRFLAIKASF
ncbi:MAG: L-asparaginase [Kordiimonadales bacterium]|nr:MAG: L-asparaginase [Kordiimonadales bacterium]